MSEAIIAAVVSAGLSLLGTVLTIFATSRKQTEEFKVQQAVMTERINALTNEVREHNNFARRMPVVEEQIKVINNRIRDLEDDNK